MTVSKPADVKINPVRNSHSKAKEWVNESRNQKGELKVLLTTIALYLLLAFVTGILAGLSEDELDLMDKEYERRWKVMNGA